MASSDGRQSLPQFSKSQLAQLFGVHRNTVTARLRDAVPDGSHKTNATYCLPTVAHLLIDTDAILAIKTDVAPANMPPDMAKDYWDAQLKEQQFRQRDGELWRDASEDVLMEINARTIRRGTLFLAAPMPALPG